MTIHAVETIIIILLCMTQQLKNKDKLSTWFSHAKKTVFV